MSVQVRRRREAAAFLATFVGAQGELIVDTTNNRVQVHDGATAGGFPAAKLSEVAGLAPVQSIAGRVGAVTLGIADVSGAAPLASPALTGTPTAPTPTTADNSTKIATTAWVAAQGFGAASASAVTSVAGRTGAVTLGIADVSGAAPLASPALTGTPTAPTPTTADNSTKLATTAYVTVAASAITARKTISDTAYTVLPTDRLVALSALSASRTLTLPAASTYPQGATLTVVDESGACSPTITIILAPNGSDTINGATGAVISSAYGYLAIESNGSGKWTVIDQTPSTAVTALTTVAQSASGATMQFGVLEQLLTLSGSSTTSTTQIPTRAIVFAVSVRTVTAITGAPSYGAGVSGNATQFGGSLGATAGSTNSGVIGPTAFYAATPIVITATSGSFTGGQVRVAIQYLLCGAPSV